MINASNSRTRIVKQLIDNLNTDGFLNSGAILITGPWGVGKTHFWKSEIAPKIVGKKAYVSLFGLRTLAELKGRVFSAVLESDLSFDDNGRKFSALATGFASNLKSLISGGAHLVTKKYLGEDAAAILNSLDIKFDVINLIPQDLTICFDDVERMALPSEELLGFVNSMIEQKHAKVVLIADETKLDEKFKDYKEKLVWLTYKCESSVPEAFEIFITGAGSQKTLDQLNEFAPLVLECFARAFCSNLRTLQRAIRILNSVLTQVTLPRRYAKFLIALVIEDATSGGLSSDASIYEGNLHRHAEIRKGAVDADLTDAEIASLNFNQRYFAPNSDNGFSPSLYRFISDGYLNVEALYAEIAPPDTKEEAVKLSEFTSWGQWVFDTDDSVLKLINQVVDMLNSTDEMHIGVVFQLRKSLGNMCRHLDLQIPDVSNVISKRIKKRAKMGDELEVYQRFLKPDELADLEEVNSEFQTSVNIERRERLRKAVLDAISRNVDLLYDNSIRYSKYILEVVMDDFVLSTIDSLVEDKAETHFRFYQFVIDTINSSGETDVHRFREKFRNHIKVLEANAKQKGVAKRMSWLLEALSSDFKR